MRVRDELAIKKGRTLKNTREGKLIRTRVKSETLHTSHRMDLVEKNRKELNKCSYDRT